MRPFTVILGSLLLSAATVFAQEGNNGNGNGAAGDEEYEDLDIFSPYTCPEKNGLFIHHDQCDAYYICEDGVWEGALCEDGYVFDDSRRNHESCKLPHGIDCGDRVYLQEPSEERDERCPRANGIFDHESDCGKFYLCDKGTAHELDCIPGLMFDNTIGSCVNPDQLNENAKQCEVPAQSLEVDGFSCPAGAQLHQGIVQAHPVYAHPHDCQFFFSCLNGKTPMKLGCGANQAFDEKSKVCKVVEEVPECSCWYECLEDSECPETCNADCSCPAK